ncbi:MAG: TonB-dependent siderophore receptor [Geobacteraceae bacterium]|nr:TonB-dependent siderophore receptor [Geobacteraceae bacterium]
MTIVLLRLMSGIAFICFLLCVTGMTARAEESETTQPTQSYPSVKNEPVSVPLTDIEVVATKAPAEGSAENGYRVESVSIPGSLGSVKLLDTPYSVNVLSEDFLKNQQVETFKEATKYLPSVQIEERGGADVGRPQTRGFEGSVVQNNRMDGMNMVATTAYPMEQFERIEILNGLAGSMYGPSNPAGIFNFVLKRPTDKPLRRISIGYDSQLIGTAHADFGDRVGKNGWFGYRVNMLFGDGIGFVDHSNLRRELASVALDIHPFKKTTLELNYSFYDFLKLGYPGGFSFAPTVNLPDAQDATRVGYGQSYAGMHLTTNTGSARVKHEFNEDWQLIVGILDQRAVRDMYSPTNTLTNNLGDYKTTIRSTAASEFRVFSNMAYLNGRFKTWGVGHDLVLGTTGFEWGLYSGSESTTLTLGTANIYNPISYDALARPASVGTYQSSDVHQQGLNLTDTISFTDQWSIRLSGSQDWIWTDNFDKTGAWTSGYDDNGFSVATSLMYKPYKNMTAYFTYADSLQQGDTAPTTGPVNAGTSLPAYRSSQYEAGFKMALSKVNLSTALFRIERPFAYTDSVDNVFKVIGNQVNYGLELMAAGEVIDGVTVSGGVTLLDPRLKDTGKATTTNKQVVGVPNYQSNLFIEYRVPVVTGLTVNFNWHYTGNRPANDTNTTWAKSYNTFDLGARYSTKLGGVPTTWRFAVTNLADEQYWSSIFPGSINGTGGSSSAFLGSPREFKLSMQMDF